jgi:hypothetical protein
MEKLVSKSMDLLVTFYLTLVDLVRELVLDN